MSSPGFVQLDRRVLDLDDLGEEDVELRVARSVVRLNWGLSSPLMTWDELLASSRHAVVLGEPGAGKSWELIDLAERLTDRGEHADFVRLELLLDDPQLALHGIDLTHAEEHLLLLDALDETKLKSRHALERCLLALRRESGVAWSRLRLVVSCRVSDWQPRADGATLQRLLPEIPADGVHDKALRVVGLAPLIEAQIAALARAKGVTSPEAFLQALATAGAGNLCGRPRDVVELIEFWNRHGKLGRLGEVLEDNLARKLSRPDTRVEPVGLSLEEARRGAEDLAAAVVLCRTFSVRLPDEVAEVGAGVGAIDPVQALVDWPADKIQTLLSRPVFDEATLGRVRFHHRTVVEYLAASWVRRLLAQGCPWRSIERLFLGRIFGREVLLPGTSPVAAWLSVWDPRFVDLSIRHAPNVLLQHGDPQALPIEVRQRVLVAYAQRYHDRVRLPRADDWAMLARFADEALSPTILRLLGEHADNAELCTELMRLAASGPLPGCGDAAVRLAADGGQGTWVRVNAIDLVVELASPSQLGRLLEYLEEEPAIEPRVLHRLWSRLFPAHLPVEALLTSMRKHRGLVETDPTTEPGYVLDYLLVPQCPADQLVRFLSGLRALAQETAPGKARAWLTDGLCQTLVRMLRELPSAGQPLQEELAIFDLLVEIERTDHRTRSEMSGHRWRTDVRQASEQHPDLRRAFFWHRHGAEERLRVWRLEPLGFGQGDLEWVLQDLANAEDQRRRRIALTAAVNLVEGSAVGLDRVRMAVADSADLTAALEAMLAPAEEAPPDDYQLKQQRRAELEQEVIAGNRDYLSGRLDSLRAGSEEAVFCRLVEQYPGDSCRRSALDWARMEEHLGPDVVQAAQDGLARWWQGYEPPARSGDAKATLGVSMALVGLERFFARGGRAIDLTTVSARRAAIVATWELNEVPTWLDQVAAVHPDSVRQVLVDALRVDLSDADDHGVLGKIAHRAGSALELVAPHVLGLLAAREATAPRTLKAALSLVTSRPQDHAALARILPDRVRSSQGQPTHLLWLVAWLAVDADSALDWLEQIVNERGDAEADRLVLDLLAFVHEGGLPLRTDSSVFRPGTLARFVALAYGRVRPAQDENPLGPHTPSQREDAQQGRSLFLQALGAQTSEEAYRALVDLTLTGNIAERSTLEWIGEMAQQVAERLAAGPPWTPAQVAELSRAYEAPPRTANDLFQLTLDRLDDLESRLEGGDFSVRQLFRPKAPEVLVQKWLADELERAARGRYCVARESEVDLAKKPDIRLSSPAVDGPVTIEVKVADSWTYAQLEDALRQQLVGQYLRANNSRHGVLFLALLDDSRRWEPSAGEHIGFHEVLRRLRAVAHDLESSHAGVEQLRVVGLRLGTSAAATKRPLRVKP